ncbi:peptidyl-tRNA hydrolase-domain-containing protein [Phycomyces nitens]|nr:peptidyl-tRNA hydrolase-domain-containing protein [Phycomyces nitens]
MQTIRVLLVGLGNYTHPNTRHNVGMMVLDQIANKLDLTWTQNRTLKASISQTLLDIENKDKSRTMINVTLLKPRLLMNVSGPSVSKAVREFSIDPSNIYVLHDDLQRPLGKVSMKSGGSANGHNGIKSVIQHLCSDNFKRVRIGIGRPPDDPSDRSHDAVADFVLSRFTSSEMSVLEKEVYPLLDVGPGLGLETLCGRGELWKFPKPPKQKKPKVKSEANPQYTSNSDQSDVEGKA